MRMEHAIPQPSWMAWFVCLSAGLFFFYEFFQLNVFDVINAPLREAFRLDAAQLSWLSSTYLWADILFLLPAGIILDRYSVRSVILSALFLCIMGTAGFALTHSFALAAFCHFLSGIGNAFCFLSCVVLVTRWFSPRRQALIIGCIVTMAFMGGMMAHTPFAFLTAKFGWRYSLLLDAGLGVLFFVWIFLFVNDKPAGEVFSKKIPGQNSLHTFVCALSNPQNWLTGIYTCCLNLPIMVLCALWGANYLQIAHNLSSLAASNVVSLLFMGSIIGCPLAGWLSDKQGHRKPLMIAGAVVTLGLLIPLLVFDNLPTLLLSLLFFSLGLFTSTQVISYPLIAESNPLHNTGAATGIASVIIMGGGGLSQVLFGMLMQHHAKGLSIQYSAADFQFAMWMFPVAVLMALFAIAFTRETYCKRSF